MHDDGSPNCVNKGEAVDGIQYSVLFSFQKLIANDWLLLR